MAVVRRLHSAFRVDLAINRYKKRIVIIRFGDEAHPDCKPMDDWILASRDESSMSNAAILLVDTKDVPELVARYNLSGPYTLVFFHDKTVRHRLSGEKIKRKQAKKKFVEVMESTCKENNIPLSDTGPNTTAKSSE